MEEGKGGVWGGGARREKLVEKREAGSGRMADACQVLIVLIDMPIFTLVTAASVCVGSLLTRVGALINAADKDLGC